MREPNSSYIGEFQHRMSPRPAIIALAAAGWLVGVSSQFPETQLPLQNFGLLLLGLSALGWLLANWRPMIGRWFTTMVLIVIPLLIHSRWGVPGALALSAIPTGLAAVMLNLPTAVGVALVQTSLLLLVPQLPSANTGPAEIGLALIANWATLGICYAADRPMRRLASWSWQYYERARDLLADSQNRKQELAQALDDLAHANRQLSLTNKRLGDLRQVAEEAQKAKAAFVAKVSHEFRTPLNMIIGLVDLLVETPEVYGEALPEALTEDLGIVHRNCEHLASMINDVLALSQIESGNLVLHRERVGLADLVDKACAVVKPLLRKKRLRLENHIAENLPTVYCDPTRIRQVILNLVSNAARFTAHGGITVSVQPEDDRVRVSVADTGPGIAPEDVERIFEPFCQGSASPWRDKGGSGLGLSISRQFVRLHGGRIWLESRLGAGSTFRFELPVTQPLRPAARPGHQISENWVWFERRGRKRRAPSGEVPAQPRLIVCDESGGLHNALSVYSGETDIVETADLTETVQEISGAPADAVLLNAAAPDAMDTLAERARKELHDTPIVVCSIPTNVQRAAQAGSVEYLVKPVTRADLVDAMHRLGKPVHNVLVVDDDPDVLLLLARMLYTYDPSLTIVTASDGAGALTQLETHRVDLVLLDILMPDMDGWQVLEQMRQRAGGQGVSEQTVPTVLISAQDPREQPLSSPALLVAYGEGISLRRVLDCTLGVSELLLRPHGEPDPEPG